MTVFEAGNNTIENGQYEMRDVLHRGRRMKIQQGKKVTPTPSAGNPALELD
ncbi:MULTISPECIES: hypothetical protein [unclassified Streptomyces]|uniref:hypothetical protein n=1 Tax=unclassified Streptomyces TaxID=2593676 RepID=UPI0036FCE0FD